MTTSILGILALLIITVFMVAVVFACICYALHRGNMEMGVADTQGRESEEDAYLAKHDTGWDRGSEKTIASIR